MLGGIWRNGIECIHNRRCLIEETRDRAITRGEYLVRLWDKLIPKKNREMNSSLLDGVIFIFLAAERVVQYEWSGMGGATYLVD